jgi:hypothetical protein
MNDPQKIEAALRQFTGSEAWTKWSPLFPRDLLTDGATYVAEECGAYWLMDAIASWQHHEKVRGEEFQVWELFPPVGEINAWLLVCEDGNDNRVVEQSIEYSDFPLDSIKLYAVRNELGGVTLLLPSEY